MLGRACVVTPSGCPKMHAGMLIMPARNSSLWQTGHRSEPAHPALRDGGQCTDLQEVLTAGYVTELVLPRTSFQEHAAM